MDQLHDIRAFVEVARTGSFVRAGENLRQSNSAVSKAVSRLEARLDVRLFQRTTRHLALTEEGRRYCNDCQRILDELEQANDAVTHGKVQPQGRLKIHFPLLWARDVVMPALPEFQQRYPEVALQMVFSEAHASFDEAYDLIVQVETTPDENRIVRPLCPTRSLVAAAPAYLQRAGTPVHPDELTAHDCIRFMMSDVHVPVPWSFMIHGALEQRLMQGRIDVSDPDAMVVAALAGLGLIQGPDILLRSYLEQGRLQQVLQPWEAPGPTICMMWLRDRYLSNRLRVFMDWLIAVAERSRA